MLSGALVATCTCTVPCHPSTVCSPDQRDVGRHGIVAICTLFFQERLLRQRRQLLDGPWRPVSPASIEDLPSCCGHARVLPWPFYHRVPRRSFTTISVWRTRVWDMHFTLIHSRLRIPTLPGTALRGVEIDLFALRTETVAAALQLLHLGGGSVLTVSMST